METFEILWNNNAFVCVLCTLITAVSAVTGKQYPIRQVLPWCSLVPSYTLAKENVYLQIL